MAEDGDVSFSPEEELAQRHRKERKALQAEITKLKHGVPKGDKKKKKEMTAKVALMEAELDEKHNKETEEFKKTNVEGGELAEKLGDVNLNSDGNAEPQAPKKPSKAQKRREKKAAEDKEREQRIKEQDALAVLGPRHKEMLKMKSILKGRGLNLHEVPPDGNCLFSAIEHQLHQKEKIINVQTLRKKAAEQIREAMDDYMPFLCNQETGDLFTQEEFEKYCEDIEHTTAWGGQHEIKALSKALGMPIEVIQADSPSIITGQEFVEEEPIIITYHRHIITLGEHYNSVVLAEDRDEEGAEGS